ncbi:MAG: GNAT family N-acetyltransferase [Porphyromonadaceae bacterium]|nr:GNAT family N-acetyltransferase [Porphyromonadaceae bacterium]
MILDFGHNGASASSLSSTELETLRLAYLESFPTDEQRPWEQLLGPIAEEFRFVPIYDRDEALGFVTLWILGDVVYVEHLMTLPQARGRGLGARVIECILEFCGPRPLVLEVEYEGASAMASRRIGFYHRLGLSIQPIDYLQPPYTSDGASVPLHLMCSRDLPLPALEQVRADLYRYVYRVEGW